MKSIKTDLDPLTTIFLFCVIIFFSVFLVIPIVTIISAAFVIDGQFSFDYFVGVFKNPVFFELEIRSFLFISGFGITIYFVSKLVHKLQEEDKNPINFARFIILLVLSMGFLLVFALALEYPLNYITGIILALIFVCIGVLINKLLKLDITNYFFAEGVTSQLTILGALPIIAFILWVVSSLITQIMGIYDTFDHAFNTHFAIYVTILIGALFSFFHGRNFSRSLVDEKFLRPFLWMLGTCFLVVVPFLFDNINIIVEGWKANFFERLAEEKVIIISGLDASVLVNTLFVAVTTTILSAGIGVLFAFIIARYEFFGKSIMRVLLLIPLVIPPFVGAIGVKRMLAHPRGYSFFNRLLYDAIPFLNYPLIMKGLTAVILVQSVHFYTLVYLNSLSAFQNIDPTLEEQAENFGAKGRRIFRTVTFPLALPGIAAGSILTFILSVEDLGTPLIFSGDTEIENLLTTRVFRMWMDTRGVLQGDGLALAVILFLIAIVGFTVIRRYVGIREYAMISKGGTFNPRTRRISIWTTILIWLGVLLLMSFALMPHVGTFLLAVSNNFTWDATNPAHLFPTEMSFELLSPDIGDIIRVVTIPVFWIIAWIFLFFLYRYLKTRIRLPDSETNPIAAYGLIGVLFIAPITSLFFLPDDIFLFSIRIPLNVGIGTYITDSIGYFGGVLGIEPIEYIGVVGGFSDVIQRTTLYALIAIILIILLGIAAAYVLARKQFPGKYWFDTLVTSPIAIPGIIIGFGLFAFYFPFIADLMGQNFAFEELLPGFYMVNFLLIFSYTVRRFPFTVRAAYAGLQQTHETFEEASKNLGASNIRTILRITIPLIAISVIAGAMMSFVYSLGEVSTSLILLGTDQQATIPWMINEKNSDVFPKESGVTGMNEAAALGMLLVLLQIIIISIANQILKQR
ncbi:MAG: iron ABC transporter permease, partial [Candidatus Heimdallarchaeota archaeon]